MALVDQLKQIRQDLVDAVGVVTAGWAAAGCPVTYSVDGESYQWSEWLEAKTREIDALTASIQKIASPFIVRSRGRA